MTITLDGTLGVTTPAETITGTLAVTGITTVAAGSAALPSIVSTTGTADTGMWFPAADTVAWSTAGTERVRFDSSGNVGVGTSSPSNKLDVSGTGNVRTSTTSSSSTGISSIYAINSSNAVAGSAIYGATASAYGSISAGESSFYSNVPISVMSDNASGVIKFATGGSSEKMRIDSSGNVGIGKTPTNKPLEIYSASNPAIRIQNSTTGTGSTDGFLLEMNSSDAYLYNYEAGNLFFGTSNTERMRINSSGQVMVNTTTATGNFTVASTSTTSVPIATKSPASFTTATYWSDSATAASTGWYHFYSTSSSATVQNCIIFGNGNIQNANNSYGAISDIKLKENIVDATPKLEQLNQVRVVNFNLKSSPEQKQLGVIAQELESIFPGMIDEINDRDADNNVLETKTKSVKYSVFVPMLIKAMQEQQAIIETLTARITALETE